MLYDKRSSVWAVRAAFGRRNLGYANVSVYAGGKKDWVDAGFPVERDGAALEVV